MLRMAWEAFANWAVPDPALRIDRHWKLHGTWGLLMSRARLTAG